MSTYYKYPRTFHFSHSENLQNDDRYFRGIKFLEGQEVIASLKLDGEGCHWYNDYIHARSISKSDHPSRHWVKQLHASVKYDIPDGWRICGENVYALHSIYYTNLPTYFFVFGIYNEKNECLKWDEICEYCDILNLYTVPVFYRGIFDIKKIHETFLNYNFDIKGWTFNQGNKDDWYNLYPFMDINEMLNCFDFNNFRQRIDNQNDIEKFGIPIQEGYVVRLAESFNYDDYTSKCCAKWVRKNHVCSSNFWLNEKIIPNKLRDNND